MVINTMRNYQKIIVLTLLLLAGSASAVTVGQPVDEFALQSLEGVTHRSSDYRGKVLILAVFGHS